MARPTHQNLCDYADGIQSLYQLWDNDLKKCIRKRQLSEFIAFAFVLISLIAWGNGRPGLTALTGYLALAFLYLSVKYMIDESNTNYLMHQWDLADAVERLKQLD